MRRLRPLDCLKRRSAAAAAVGAGQGGQRQTTARRLRSRNQRGGRFQFRFRFRFIRRCFIHQYCPGSNMGHPAAVLNLAVSNGQLNLNIGGTAGATVQLQSTTNPTAPFSWTTITNVALTNIAPMETNAVPGQPQDAIDLAYVPAAQIAPLPTTTSSARMQFFRVVMPYDYIILAGLVLPAKGYTARLVVVNMPGLNDDACYVSQAGSYIHYSQTNSVLQLAGAGSTIRQIATTLANSLNLDWTTASEFTYSNGMGQILATVVEADPASSDPVAGQNPTSSIVINF